MSESDGIVPCSPEEAVARMLELEASRKGCYIWAAGHYDPLHPALLGMTQGKDPDLYLWGWDCFGAAGSYAYRLTRHRPGFNRTPYASVDDDLNVDSAYEDSDPKTGKEELFERVTAPVPGVLILTPTIRGTKANPNFYEPGHVRMVIDASKWDGTFASLVWLECKGPPRRAPGVVRNSGESIDHWNAEWPTHQAVMVRVRAAG